MTNKEIRKKNIIVTSFISLLQKKKRNFRLVEVNNRKVLLWISSQRSSLPCHTTRLSQQKDLHTHTHPHTLCPSAPDVTKFQTVLLSFERSGLRLIHQADLRQVRVMCSIDRLTLTKEDPTALGNRQKAIGGNSRLS